MSLFQNFYKGDWSGSHIWLVQWMSCTSALDHTGYSTATIVPPASKEGKGQAINKSILLFYDNHTSCKLYSVETGSIPKDSGDKNKV